MKRKIFSKLLMVALVIAAVGSFVSCKDYDDDINNLQKQIDAKAAISELTALQSTLEGKISTATAAAQKAAEDAAAKADASLKSDLEKAIADAKKAGTDAGTEAGKAITAANKAQETADAAAAAAKKADEDAKAALADALKTIGETYQTKADAEAALKTIGETYFTITEATELKTELANLKSDLESSIDEKIADAIAELGNAAAAVDAIWGAVTSVELVPSGKGFGGIGALQVDELYFLKGTEVNNAFGAAVVPAGNAAMPYDGHAVAEIKNYKAGDPVKFDNRIVIRVNPANAAFTADDVVLINSKGQDLSDLVTIAVEPYTQLITRGDYETGLYVVSVARKGDVTEDDFYKTVGVVGDKYDADEAPMLCQGEVLYAIGINNSKDAAEKRYVNTTFDVGVNYGDYIRQDDFTFDVVGKDNVPHDITALHNRWNGQKLVGEDLTAETPVAGKWNMELAWKAESDDNKAAFANHVDTTSVNQSDAKYRNWEPGTVANTEARQALETYIVVDKDARTFTINGIDAVNPYATINDLNLVQWYYVTLDKFAAVESAPSEWESWNSYEYTGLYTVTPAIDRLRITIDSKEAIGDVIGFRVFAVNYDGSLADPDGKAFYVQVGDPYESAKNVVKGAYTAKHQAAALPADAKAIVKDIADKTDLYNAGIQAIDFDASKAFINLPLTAAQATGAFNLPLGTATNANYDKVNTAGAVVTGQYWLCKDADGTLADNWQNIKYVAIAVTNPQQQVDRQTAGLVNAGAAGTAQLKLQGLDPDHHNRVANELTFNVTKNMPSAPQGFSWKDGAGVSGNNVTLYFTPSTGVWNALATFGSVNLTGLMNGLDANYRVELADGNILNDATYELLDGAPATTTTGKKVIVKNTAFGNNGAGFVLNIEGPASLKADGVTPIGKDNYIGSKKSTTMTVKYDWANISLTCRNHVCTANASYLATVDTKTATFSYPLAENTYSTREYSYISAWTQSGAATNYAPTVLKSSAYVMEYKAIGAMTTANRFLTWANTDVAIPAGGTDLTGGANAAKWADGTAFAGEFTMAATAMPATLAASTIGYNLNFLVRSTNAKFPTYNNVALNPAWFVANYYDETVQLGSAWLTPYEVRFVSKNSGNEDYYNAISDNTGNMIYFAGTTSTPVGEVPSQLVIKATDAFQHEWKYAIDITLKP